MLTYADPEYVPDYLKSFPFLIGRMLTIPTWLCDTQARLKFPFLIGRMLTEICYFSSLPENKFPFLIGRMLTRGGGLPTSSRSSVSIPYR